MNKMNDVKPPKKPLLFYYAIALAVIILLNALVVPALEKMSITEVDYSTFLADLKSGKESAGGRRQDCLSCDQ
jgi:cell division protease FtsH